MHQAEENRRIPTLLEKGHSSILKSRGKSQYFGISDERAGNVLALKLVAQSGTQRAIHYHDIISPMDFNGDSQIVLFTTAIKIIINGRNLEKLFDYIIQHRVMWLKEPQESFIQIPGDEVEVSDISFEEQY